MKESENTLQKEAPNTFGCINCGADLKFKPGTTSLTCEYCGAKNEIPVLDTEIEELDFNEYLRKHNTEGETVEVQLIKCEGCGSECTLEPNITSSSCPFCTTPLIASSAHSVGVIQPKSMLPFKIEKQEANTAFRKWIKKLWFAPNALKKAALSFEHFKGIYLPFWTYDTDTNTQYIGQRGEHYSVTENYTATEDGKSVTKSREVQKTRWYPAAGHVHEAFDDVLIPASESLPKDKLCALEPWDLENLVPFDPKFLGGFISEKYQVELEQGFNKAKKIMDELIDRAIRNHIGGDEQRIYSSKTDFDSITFKHILLPVYASAYKFKGKVFQFMVNARTGEIQGERPWSTVKIALTIIGALLLIGGGWLLYKYLSA
jgi:hypothetical protein